jgi:hypothetical protein
MSAPCPARFTPPPSRKDRTHCTGAWVGHRAGLDWCGKPRPGCNSIPRPSISYRVAITTEPSRPTYELQYHPQFRNKLALFLTLYLYSNFGTLSSQSFCTLIIVKICRGVSLSTFECHAIILMFNP